MLSLACFWHNSIHTLARLVSILGKQMQLCANKSEHHGLKHHDFSWKLINKQTNKTHRSVTGQNNPVHLVLYGVWKMMGDVLEYKAK